MKMSRFIVPLWLAAELSAPALAAEGYQAPIYDSREEVPQESRWRLDHIYSTPQAWEEDLQRMEPLLEQIGACQGSVMASPQDLLKVIELEEQLDLMLGKIYCYAVMGSHEDTAAEEPKARADRATVLAVRASEATAFIAPEILAAPEGAVETFLDQEPRLKPYEVMLRRLLIRRPHVLPAREEALLAAMGEIASAPDQAFSMLTDADMTFPDIADSQGNRFPLTQESYGRYITSPDRALRQAAFEGIHRTFASFGNTLAATYSASVKADVTFARLRNYGSALEAALTGDEIPTEVYTGLVETVNNHLPALADYVALKKEVLAVESMEPWDLYAPLSQEPQRTYSYDQAKELVLAALAPLGEEYLSVMSRGLNEEGWVDVYENKGKRSGAYSWGTYGVHPYILLNYGGTFRDVSTLAHEGGHAMHSWYSQENQPQTYADYVIFVAEVASTVNESLLTEYLLAHTEDRQERIFLLSQQLELIRQTIYRQTLFAEFELTAHQMAQEGQPLTPQVLSGLWSELNRRYYGPEVGGNADLAAEWSRIPHFYRDFYVYQYATSLAAALAITDRILTEGEEAREAYFSLLKGGSSKDPISLLKDAGVDMSTPEPVDRALKVFARKTQELKALIESQ